MPMSNDKTQIDQILARQEASFAMRFNWWWRYDVPLGRHKIKAAEKWLRLMVKKEPSAFWYEIESRQRGYDVRGRPKYLFGAPFFGMDISKRDRLVGRYPIKRDDLQMMSIHPWINEYKLPPEQNGLRHYLLDLNLKDFPDGTLVTAFAKELRFLRALTGVPAPAFKTQRAHRTQSKGPSFRPIEALDVMKFSDNEFLRIKFRRDFNRAEKLLLKLRQFTDAGISPRT